jgi:hypothetical protein
MPNNMAFKMFFYGKALPLGDKKRTYEGPKEI